MPTCCITIHPKLYAKHTNSTCGNLSSFGMSWCGIAGLAMVCFLPLSFGSTRFIKPNQSPSQDVLCSFREVCNKLRMSLKLLRICLEFWVCSFQGSCHIFKPKMRSPKGTTCGKLMETHLQIGLSDVELVRSQPCSLRCHTSQTIRNKFHSNSRRAFRQPSNQAQGEQRPSAWRTDPLDGRAIAPKEPGGPRQTCNSGTSGFHGKPSNHLSNLTTWLKNGMSMNVSRRSQTQLAPLSGQVPLNCDYK